jgi:hypothetical protein
MCYPWTDSYPRILWKTWKKIADSSRLMVSEPLRLLQN